MIPITDATVRAYLLSRAQKFSDERGVSLSNIGKEAVRDDRFLHRVSKGENFTMKSYQLVIDWLDAAERERPPGAPSANDQS